MAADQHGFLLRCARDPRHPADRRQPAPPDPAAPVADLGGAARRRFRRSAWSTCSPAGSWAGCAFPARSPTLNEEQWALVKEAIQLLPAGRAGDRARHQPHVPADQPQLAAPAGRAGGAARGRRWQSALVVTHSFGAPLPAEIRVPLPGQRLAGGGDLPAHRLDTRTHRRSTALQTHRRMAGEQYLSGKKLNFRGEASRARAHG